MEFREKRGTNATTSKKQALGKSCSWRDGRIIKNLFLLRYFCSTLSNFAFPHNLNSNVTSEVDEFFVSKLHKTINAIEALLQGKTRGLGKCYQKRSHMQLTRFISTAFAE